MHGRIYALVLLLSVAALAVDKSFSVTEGFGVARTQDPVSGGIAFCKGEALSPSALSLFRGAQEIPAQFVPLTRYPDNSLQWVLVDFNDAFQAGERKDYAIRTQAPAVTPAAAIGVTRSGSIVTLDNGVLRFSVDTLNFRGLHSLEYKGTPLLSGDGGLSLLDVKHGSPSLNGPVTKAAFVYLGRERATLRIEGRFFLDSAGGMGYSYLVTVHSGIPRITISATIRNSINPTVGRAARINYATAGFALAYDPVRTIAYDTAFPPAYTATVKDTLKTVRAYDHPSGKGLAFFEKWGGGLYMPNINRTTLIGRRVEVDMVRKLQAVAGYPDYYSDSVYVMRDLTQKTSEITLECYDGAMTATELRNSARRVKGRLHPFQDSRALSDANALSSGKFGTVSDEEAAFAKWGWTVPTDVRRPDIPPAMTDVAPRLGLSIHGDSETDPCRNFLLQWVRTGKQGFFDVGESWAKYYRDLVTWRTTGFEQDGQYQVGSYVWQKAKRLPALPAAGDDIWTGYVADYNTFGGCHTAMEGVADYYCLTGDPDVLDALVDHGELEKARTFARLPDTNASTEDFTDRGPGRKFCFLIRLYEITKDPVWRDLLKIKARAMARSLLRDPVVYARKRMVIGDAKYFELGTRTGLPDSLKGYIDQERLYYFVEKYGLASGVDSATGATWPLCTGAYWMAAYMAQGYSRYYELFGDEDIRDMLIGYAQFIKWTMTQRCNLADYNGMVFDVPRRGMATVGNVYYEWDPAHAACYSAFPTASGSMPGHASAMPKTVLLPSICAMAYAQTGFSYLLDEAKTLWNRGSKFSGARFLKPESTVFSYAFCGTFQGTQFYPTYKMSEYKDDYLFQVCHTFREAVHHTDTVPPERIADLFVRRLPGNAGVQFEWTAPAGAAEYQLKFIKGKRIQEYPDFEYNYNRFNASGDTGRVSWWYASNVAGEPLPSAAGSPQSFMVAGDFPATDTFYAVLCSRDTMGNLSRLSNTVRIDASTIAAETGSKSTDDAFRLSAKPNPFNPAVDLRINLPKGLVGEARIKIFDRAGRLVREYKHNDSHGIWSVAWDGTDRQNRPLSSGAYVVRAEAGRMRTSRILTLMK